jgi:SAM-dependent methyltransferase
MEGKLMGHHQECTICASATELIYEPKKSIVGIQILICKVCGFVQSQKTHPSAEFQGLPAINSLSCDADYSPIRVGKQQMTDVDVRNIESLNLPGIEEFIFLDMASARGHFARWARSTSQNKVVCLEPDAYMTNSYNKDSSVELHIGDYRQIELLDRFDFIYSCHTLEHFIDPVDYLSFVHAHLKPLGYFYVNVPNLSGIVGVTTLDDFFYDKHRVYFDLLTLQTLLGNQGFIILSEWVDSACIRLLVRKIEKQNASTRGSSYVSNREIISNYIEDLGQSRLKLPTLVSELHTNLEHESTRIVFGCGRMLDALISYGHLDLSSFHFLVDNYLGLATKMLYGRDLYRLDNLPEIKGGIQFVVVSRTSNLEIANLISNKFPTASIFFFASLLNR